MWSTADWFAYATTSLYLWVNSRHIGKLWAIDSWSMGLGIDFLLHFDIVLYKIRPKSTEQDRGLLCVLVSGFPTWKCDKMEELGTMWISSMTRKIISDNIGLWFRMTEGCVKGCYTTYDWWICHRRPGFYSFLSQSSQALWWVQYGEYRSNYRDPSIFTA